MFFQATFWFALAFLFAAVEIEIEGKYGWAERTPTWYRTTGIAARIYGLVMGGKPLTGYHLWMFLLSVMIFHIPFASGVEWSWQAEFTALSIYFAWAPLWDFLWFVLNPHWGLKNFKRDRVWWHAKSWWVLGFFPLDYLVGWFISIVFATASTRLEQSQNMVPMDHLCLLGGFLACTFVTVLIIAPWYHKWYQWMLRKDDRDKTHIFHIRNSP